MQDETQIIGALTSLIELNNKRMKLYQSLVGKIHHKELRSLFSHYSEQSKEFSNTLSTWRSAYGGFRLPEKKGIGGVRTWIASLLEHWSRKKVASKCEEMEQDALKTYRKVIQLPFVPDAIATEIGHQSKAFDKALIKLRTLRDQAGNNISVREELVHTIAV